MVNMNKEILIDKVSRLLGVSTSEKEFAFQIFIEKTADVLELNEALKYPDLGYFYFKEDDPSKQELTDYLLYVPIQDKIDPLEDNFFLSFEVQKKNRDNLEFDSSVFSLSIEKSTLPFEKDSGNNTDISYHLLKKTIEERVEDLISTAVHLENFNIADSLLGGTDSGQDITPEKEIEHFIVDDNQSYEEMVFSRMSLDEALSSFPPDKENEYDSLPEYEKKYDTFDVEEEPVKPEPVTADIKEIENELSGDDSLINDQEFFESIIEEKNNSGFVPVEDVKENIEWKWADELSVEEEKANNEKPVETEAALTAEETTKHGIENNENPDDLFAELESVIIPETVPEEKEIEKADENINSAVSPVHEEPTTIMMEKAMKEENENIPEEENNYNTGEEDNSKRNIILIGVIIVIVLVAAGIIFFNGFGIIKKKSPAPPQVKPDSTLVQNNIKQDSASAIQNQAIADTKGKASGAKPQTTQADKTQKVKESQAGDLLKEIKNESKVGSNIYTDGKTFYVQVSSWKNISKAEQEVKKLRAKGETAFMVKAYIEEFKGTWYRVRVGSFKSREEAEAFSKKNRL